MHIIHFTNVLYRCLQHLFGDQFWHNTLRTQLNDRLHVVLQHLQSTASGLEARLAAKLRDDPLIAAKEKRAYGFGPRDCLQRLAGSVFQESVANQYPECMIDKAFNVTAAEHTTESSLGKWLWKHLIQSWRIDQLQRKRCSLQLADVYACVVSKRAIFLSTYANHVDILRSILHGADTGIRHLSQPRIASRSHFRGT